MRRPKRLNVPGPALPPKDAPFDPAVPRWWQWTEDVHIGLVRPGTGRRFTEACRRLGVKNYIAFERIVEKLVNGEITL
jgi:hypothetical protein